MPLAMLVPAPVVVQAATADEPPAPVVPAVPEPVVPAAPEPVVPAVPEPVVPAAPEPVVPAAPEPVVPAAPLVPAVPVPVLGLLLPPQPRKRKSCVTTATVPIHGKIRLVIGTPRCC